MSEVPKGLADKWDLLRDTVAEHLFEMRKTLKEAIGGRPYRGMPTDPNELAARWGEIRQGNLPALTEVIKSNVKYTADGRVLVPSALLDSMREQEERRRKGGLD